MGLRSGAEVRLGRLARVLFRHPWRALSVCAVASLVLLSGLPMLRIDSSMESLLTPEDATRVAYDTFRDQFGSDEQVLLLVGGDDLFSRDFVNRLAALHRELEQTVPFTESVDSLINARVTRGSADELIVEDLFEVWPESDEALDAIRARANANPLYQNLLVSADGQHTLVTVEVLPPDDFGSDASEALSGFDGEPAAPAHARVLNYAEIAQVVAVVDDIVARHSAAGFEIQIAGGVHFTYVMTDLIQTEMGFFTATAVVAIAALLALLFRRGSGVALPLVVALLSLATVFGAMGLIDMPLSPISQVFPSLLLAVGTSGVVHLLAIFYPAFDKGASAEDAIAGAFEHSGLPVLMASATTAGGLVSFVSVELEAFASFGIAAPLGVLLAVFYSWTLVPALLAVLPLRRRAPAESDATEPTRRLLQAFGNLACRRPWTVVVCWGLLFLVSLAGAMRISPSYHPLQWLATDEPFRIAAERIDEIFGGSLGTEMIIDTGRPDGLKDPEVLSAIAALQDKSQQPEAEGARIAKVLTIADVVRETHAALHGGDPNYYRIPEDRELIGQELLLFEATGPDEVAELADSQLRIARVRMLTSFSDGYFLRPLLDELEEHARRIGPGPGTSITGLTAINARSFDVLVQGLLRSYGLALLIIVPLMIVFVGSVTYGLLSMIPNVIPIVIGLGFMYATGLPLDIFSSLIGSIAIGIAVDDTIHFMHGFRRALGETGDPEEAIHRTLQSTGRALFVTSAALTVGFLTFTFAAMTSVVYYGVVTALVVSTALLADLLLSPAVVLLLTRGRAS